MALRCTFHVSPLTTTVPTEPQRPRMPSVVEIEAEPEAAMPRGRSFETWTRARGWASED